MQWLAQLSVRRPVLASVLILTLTVIGAFSFTKLGVDRYPKVDFPTIIVTTRQPGASPEQIETEISDRVEEAVNTISGIDELRSVSSEGVSLVSVGFILEKDTDVAAQEVRDKINRILPLLPRTIEQPTVEKFDPDSSPVLTLAVTSSRPLRDVTEFADKVLRRQLESVNGVGQVTVLGGRARQINLDLDADRLRAHNLTVTDVARALEGQNSEIPGGRIEQGPKTLTLRTLGRVRSVEQFNDIVIRQAEGHPVLLRDVATVDDGMADATSLANVNGVGSVVLQIRRQSGTNTVEVVNAIKERLGDVRKTLPPGYDVRVVRDQSEFIEASIHAVEEHLVLGSILAAFVVFVFLWNARSTLISAVAIPTSIVATFGLIWYMGFTLNSMTMLALTLAVGIVIDDAIVVLENIWRFIEEKGQDPFVAAVEATREIGLAVLATTLSLVAIFVPVAFMGGIVGRFMKSFGLTMAFAVLVSMLVSFTLTPMMSARWLKRREAGESNGHDTKHSRLFAPLDSGYTALLRWAMAHRSMIVATAVAVLLATVPLFMIANKSFIPEDDQAEFEISARAPEGTSLESTEILANRIAARVRNSAPEVDYTLVTVGDGPAATPNLMSIYVRLKPLDQRSRNQFAVMQQVRTDILPPFAKLGLRTRVQPVAAFGGGGAQNATLQFVIKGPDLNVLSDGAEKIAAAVRNEPTLVDVDTSNNLGKPEVSVQVDRLKAADLNVQIADAANALRLLVGGDQVTTYFEGGEQYEVHLRAIQADRTSKAAIANLTVPSARLGSVALENVASFTDATSASEINRIGRQRQVTILANVPNGESQTTGMAAIEKAYASLQLGPAYSAAYTGRSRELGRAAQNFVLAFVLSLVFMYLILAAQFESWLHPVTILLSLPLTIPFALLSIIITQQSLNIFSALGLLVLFGVVKKNSILQIDHAIQLRASGMPRDQAVVQASRDRLRPILMTTSAFVAGMIPLVLSSGIGAGTNRAIGFVIIGGQSLVLLLTLVVTPVAYSLFDDLSRVRVWSRLRGLVPSRAAATTAGALLAALMLASPGATQTPAQPAGAPAVPAADPAAASGEVVKLTLDDAVRRAVENNSDLAIVRLQPEASATAITQAQAAFLPVLSTSFGRTSLTSPPSSVLSGSSGIETTEWFGSGTVRQRAPFGGGTWLANWDATRTGSNSPINSFDPNLGSGLLLAFSQPLLRDRLIDAARQQLVITRRNAEITDLQFKQAVVQTVAAVKTAYLDLKASTANVALQQRSLELAQELARQNQARVDVGQLPPLDLVAAQAEVAQRREQLILARQVAGDAEDRLRRLIMAPQDATFWRARLEPVDEPRAGGPRPDVDGAIRAAIGGRLDLAQARKTVENAATNVRYYDNQRLPDVRLEASYSPTGLGGTQLVRDGFLGPVIGRNSTSFGSTLRQVFAGDYPSWTLGFTVNYPLGRSYEEAGLARAQIDRRQAEARVASLEVQAIEQIRVAARQVDSTAERIEATRAGADLAEQRLNAEQKRFEVGMSTTFLVTQAQRDLVQAQVALLQATLDYQSAIIAFDVLQQAPTLSGSVTLGLNGSNVVALPPSAPRGISAGGSGSIF